jgi:hypothetical protein
LAFEYGLYVHSRIAVAHELKYLDCIADIILPVIICFITAMIIKIGKGNSRKDSITNMNWGLTVIREILSRPLEDDFTFAKSLQARKV